MLRYLQIDFKKPSINRKIFGVQLHILNKLKRFEYIDYYRINIDVLPSDAAQDIQLIGEHSNILGIIAHHIPEYPFRSKRKIYVLVKNLLLTLWKRREWPLNDLKDVFSEIQNENYECDLVYKGKKKSNDSNISAELILSIRRDSASFILYVYKSGSLSDKIEIIKTVANPYIFDRFFPETFWDEENNYVIADRDREILQKCDIYLNKVEVEYVSKNYSCADLESFYHILKYHDDTYNHMNLNRLPLI